MSEYYNIRTTIDDIEVANKITQILLEKKLVCSIQRQEVSSIWIWKGKTEYQKEYVLDMKTKKSLYKEVEKEIKKLHTYTTPEIYATEIIEASKDYFDWIEKETK